MNEERMDEVIRELRDHYNPPPAAPRDEMWQAIRAGMKQREVGVISLDAARSRRRGLVPRGLWWSAAAAAVLVVGFGLGRFSAPGAPGEAPAVATGAEGGGLRLAAVDHLTRTESLLRLVRADGREGRVDPAVGSWAEGLLTQTRLLLDSGEDQDPAMRELLEDLELVLVQIVGVAEAQASDGGRAKEELSLALRGLDDNEVLNRIQAVVPAGSMLAGT